MKYKNSQTTRYSNREIIMSILESKCPYLYDLLQVSTDELILYHKYLTHSDLITKGKRTNKNQPYERNKLYYLTNEEMKSIEKKSNQSFPTAKQSNITLPTQFYDDIEIQQLKRREGKQIAEHNHINIAEIHNVFLVNRSLDFFTAKYTKNVFSKLKKECHWSHEELEYTLDEGELTRIFNLHHAIHGIGTAKDKLFHKVRMNVFRNDSLYILIEKKQLSNNIYIFLEKNPTFYNIVGLKNNVWEDYKRISDLKLLNQPHDKILYREEKNRSLQSKWKALLAEEIMNYSANENEVFCPITYISGDIDHLSPLFIASHIKPFAECSSNEAFDLNNGLLLAANVDALFDKYLITIDDNKNIVYSFLIENDALLHQKLLINQELFKLILNEKRMQYMKHHRSKFMKLEKERQGK